MIKIPPQLWQPQKDACKLIYKYIKDYTTKATKASCLIKMPTGSGKTGVITTIAHEVSEVKSVLVICPRDALRTQLYEEINLLFFKKISYTCKKAKVCVKLLSGVDFKKSHLDKIVITTIQKLNSTKKKSPVIFNDICKKFDLVIFDEGHYEPAINWSKAIREIDSPKIIFTATPFRNDFKKFNFDVNYVFAIKHNECENLNILRKPKFIKLKDQPNPSLFVKSIIKEFNKVKAKVTDARLIIRCDDFSSILKISEEVNKTGLSFVAIHDRIDPTKNSWGHKKVPPLSTSAEIWIHQYKLLEGIDDPNFRVLASYNPIKNSRQLIQQIGRILRNISLKKNEEAVVLDNEDSSHELIWKSYIEYDNHFDKIVGKTYGDTLKEALTDLPSIEYIDRSFRKNYLSGSLSDLGEQILLPLSVNILKSDLKLDSNEIIKQINSYHEEKEYSSTYYKLDSSSGVHLYISYTNSPILANHFFFDISLNICIHKFTKNKILFFDSKGISLSTYAKDFGVRPIKSKLLKKLISQKTNSRLVNINLKNSILGNNSITGHSYSAISINNTTPYLDDHAQIVSSIVGYSHEKSSTLFNGKDTFRRYLGINNGKLTQSNKRFFLKDYLIWLDGIIKIIDGSNKVNEIFGRFASESIPTSNIKPVNILLDFSEIKSIIFQDDSGEIQEYESISEIEERTDKFYFSVKIDSKPYEIEIAYNSANETFKLKSDKISKTFWNEDKKDIIEHFNSTQSFRIITSSKNLMYAFGSFFNPQIKIGKEFNISTFQLRNILIPIKKLDKIINEKGKKCQAYNKGWDTNSLFNLIDIQGKGTLMKKEFSNTEILICDDMGVEAADFILCTKSTVAFIHIKGKSKLPVSKVSASKLMDVCGQAIKNIEYLSMFSTKVPAGIDKKWKKAWKADKVKGKVKDRVRVGNKTDMKENWEKISLKISDPSITKEVWLVLGGILSKKEFIAQLQKSSGNSVAVQALMLLNGTLSNIGSIGAKFKVFCSE